MLFAKMTKLASTLIFLSYFLFYSVSPLTFTVTQDLRQKNGYLQSSEFQGIEVLLSKIIAEKIVTKVNESHKRGNESILIMKKRALVPEDYTARLFSLDKIAVSQDLPFSLTDSVQSYYNPRNLVKRTPKGFRFLYAGHSPPFV